MNSNNFYDSCLAVVWQLSGSCPTVVWQMSVGCLAVVWQLFGSRPAVAWHFFNVNLISYFQVSNGLTSLDSVNLQELPNLHIKRV